ncbi:MAG: hypothetical protein CSA75_01480, partial [Sorangium cellulosum]
MPTPSSRPPTTSDKPTSRFRFWSQRLAATLLVLFALACLGVYLVIRHYEADLPSTAEIKEGKYRPPQVTRVLARDGSLLT